MIKKLYNLLGWHYHSFKLIEQTCSHLKYKCEECGLIEISPQYRIYHDWDRWEPFGYIHQQRTCKICQIRELIKL